MKKIIALFLSFSMILSCTFVFAESSTDEIKEIDILEAIKNTVEIQARYPEVDAESLYYGALDAVLKENPELLEKALSGMFESIDENSAYYNPEQTKKLFESLDDEIVGIGVSILERGGKIIVAQPLPGTPAEKAGIKAGDIIEEADGIKLDGMDLDTASGFIRGKEDSVAKIKIWRSSINGYLEFSIIRKKVESPSVEFEILEKEGKKIARISIFSFTENCHRQFKEALNKADSENIKNIIIDVRNNGGGYLNQAVLIADEFLAEGEIITIEDHKLDFLDITYEAEGKRPDYNVVVLINETSASASEVLTAALKENERAKVIGKPSFGKGTVQTILDVFDGSAIKFTTAYYLTPKGNNIHKKGITPDAEVSNTFKNIDMTKFTEFNYQNTYSLSDKSDEIRYAKEMLSYLGIYIGEIDDNYDQNMYQAVLTFQKLKEELFPYGVLDKTTQFSLYSHITNMKEETDDQLDAALCAF